MDEGPVRLWSSSCRNRPCSTCWGAAILRQNTPRVGRVLVARGSDVALASTFGPNTLERFRVWTDEVVER